MSTNRMLLTTLGVAVLATAAPAQTTTRYAVVDLGTIESSNVCPCFFGNAVNNANESAGFFFGTDGNYNGFLHTGDEMHDIGGLGGELTLARAMNDNGWVIGFADTATLQHAFVYADGAMIDLGTLGGPYSDATNVSNTGIVVGSSTRAMPDDTSHAFRWSDGAMTDLGTLPDGPFSDALAVNDAGLIVGWSWNAAWDQRAVFWLPNGSGPFELADLGEPERFTRATDVNASGTIVGAVEMEPINSIPQYRAVTWDVAEIANLGLLAEAGEGISLYLDPAHTSTAASAINASGVIVGNSTPTAETPAFRPGPFVHRDGIMMNLNDLLLLDDAAWIVTQVNDLNDAGVIAGSARTLDDNHSRAVLLMPVDVPQGDIDGSGTVGVADLLRLLAAWGPCDRCLEDVDGNGFVDTTDLLVILANWR